MSDERFTEALAHVERGYATLPVRGKRPASDLIHRTRGHYGWGPLGPRPASADEVAAWLALDNVGIGVITGEPSRLAVVDVDDQARAPELPPSATVGTSRGRHVYYAASEPVPSRDFSWGELKGEGRYVVAPNSPPRYRWLLSPEENGGLVDFASVDFASAAPLSYIRSSCLKRSTCPAPKHDESRRGLADLERDEATALRLAVALGAPEGLTLGETFPCLLHPDGRPSAALWRSGPDAHVLFHDFHAARHGGRDWLSFAHVRARLAGRTGPLARPELSVWKLRLAAEAELLAPLGLRVECERPPERLEPLWGGFLELLALRWLVFSEAPAPFSARFASAWCGVSKRQAHEGVRELARLGLLEQAGFDGHSRLWLPKGVTPIE